MRNRIIEIIKKVLDTSVPVEIEVPKNESWGDYSTNIAIQLAKAQKMRPLESATLLSASIIKADRSGLFRSVEPTPSGFVNFRLSDKPMREGVTSIIKENERYGLSHSGGKKILLEFVSANPTGPLHIGHGRWAVIGDCLANILSAAGNKVAKEFYVNDAGEQVSKLVASVTARMEGRDIPEDGYAGEYVKTLAEEISGKAGDKDAIRESALGILLSEQKATLESIGVIFDKWFFETELHKKGLINKCIEKLGEEGLTFKEGNALWFKSSEYGDDKDRVLIKDDGLPTYFAADIAYHMEKFDRGFDKLINVWGTDHHGYVARLKGAMTALGYPSENLEIIIGQLVALYRGKELVRMSKRTGDMITLKEVVEEIGSDAVRYFLVRSSANTHIDFDLELAKSKSMENPVYYVNYAHARIKSIMAEAKNAGLSAKENADLSLLTAEPERKLMLKLIKFEDEIASAAYSMQPHRLTAYAESLAGIFHNYYHQQRIITDDKKLSEARLALVLAASIVIRNVLKLLGIKAMDSM